MRPAPGCPRLLAAALATTLLTTGCGGDDSPERDGDRRPGVRLQQIGDFRSPVHVSQPPGVDDLLFVVEKRGVVRVVKHGREVPAPFIDLRDRVNPLGTEQGLVSIAFAPAYRQNRRFYVAYTARDDGLRIEEYRAARKRRTRARRGTRRRILTIPQPDKIHNGGLLLFGPDRHLYIGAGDGGPSYDPRGDAQDRRVLRGKILRIDPHVKGRGGYAIPKGNPFRRMPPRRPEIYAYGLRNPWRFSFDRHTGALAIGDVGQDLIEEIDIVPRRRARGANFGWSGFEGTRPFRRSQRHRDAIRPVHEYTHQRGCSVTGGYVVRDRALGELAGRYLYADFCEGELRSLLPPLPGRAGRRHSREGKDERRLGITVPNPVSFGEDGRGRIYVVSLTGPVYRLVKR